MAINITCDWCTSTIDEPDDELDYDRMGLDGSANGDHIVLESRTRGRDSDGRLMPNTVLRDFHRDCYQAALRLLDDHRAWAQLGAGTSTAHWDGDQLEASTPVHGPVSRAPTTATKQRKAPARTQAPIPRGIQAETRLDAIGLHGRVPRALRRADMWTISDLTERSECEVRAIEYVGAHSVEHLKRALKESGLSFRQEGPTPELIAEQIRNLRVSAGMSRTDFARQFLTEDELEDTWTYVHRLSAWAQRSRQWEAGTKVPDEETAQRVADVFDVSADYLMCREES